MLKNEAAWLQARLSEFPTDTLSPLLSVASGAEEVRTRVQPWISKRVFLPLEARGVQVIHHELSAGAGIDVAGDLHDDQVVAALAATGARSVLCCNLLEHVDSRERLTAALTNLVAPGGFLFVTVPHRFPYHPDPIDTMFRPSVAELAAEFPKLTLRVGEEVACGTLWRYLADAPDGLSSTLAGIRVALVKAGRSHRACAGTSGPSPGPLRFLVRSTSVTCAVFQRSTS